MPLVNFEDSLRTRSSQFAHLVEVVLHVVLAILLALGAAAAVVAACTTAWQGFRESGMLTDAACSRPAAGGVDLHRDPSHGPAFDSFGNSSQTYLKFSDQAT
ncbi:MAG: hypothetical protein ABSB35_39205 [Bryobacteraceae bacterium]|jgi:hypothetical protein